VRASAGWDRWGWHDRWQGRAGQSREFTLRETKEQKDERVEKEGRKEGEDG